MQYACAELHVASACMIPAPADQKLIPPTQATQAELQIATQTVEVAGPPLTFTVSRQARYRETSAVLNLISGHNFLLAEGPVMKNSFIFLIAKTLISPPPPPY